MYKVTWKVITDWEEHIYRVDYIVPVDEEGNELLDRQFIDKTFRDKTDSGHYNTRDASEDEIRLHPDHDTKFELETDYT